MAWIITFSDGTTEWTPREVDAVSIGEGVLYTRNMKAPAGARIVAAYPLVNIRKWERES